MYSDDEECESAVSITRLYSVKAPADSLGQGGLKDKPAPASGKPKGVVIACTCYDPLAKRLYYGLENGNFAFWQISKDGTGSSRFVGSHKGPVTCICTPTKEDGELGAAGLIVSASVDSTIKIWDYKGKVILSPTVCVQTLYGHSGTITCLIIKSGHIVSGSTDCTIKAWRAVEGRKQLVYPWYELQTTIATLPGWVRCMSYDRTSEVGDAGAIFVADDAGDVYKIVPQGVYNVETGRIGDRLEFVIEGRVPSGNPHLPYAIRRIHDRGVQLIRYVASAQILVTLAYDNCVRVYEESSGSLMHCWENEVGCQFTCLEVDVTYQEILVTDKQGYLAMYSLRTGHLNATKQLTKGMLSSITRVLGPQLYGVTTPTEFQLWQVEHELEYNVARGGHDKAVIALYTCAGGLGVVPGDVDYRIFSASLDNTVRLWDPYDMACVRVLSETDSEISAMVFFEAWNILITGHDNGTIRLWNLDTGSNVALRYHTNTVTCLTIGMLHRHEELLLSAGFDGLVCIWDVRSMRSEPPHMVAHFRTTIGRVHARRTTLPGERHGTVLSTENSSVSSNTGAAASTAALPVGDEAGEVLALRFCHIKKVIITAGNDKAIKVWSASSYEYLGRHVGHTDAVTCLALEANFLFSGSEDCSVRVWDTLPAQHAEGGDGRSVLGFVGKEIKSLLGHTRCVTSLEVIPSSGHIVSASMDSTLLFWDYVTGEILRRYQHTEEFKCIALRFDRDEVLIGTEQANILRYETGEVVGPAPYALWRASAMADESEDVAAA